MKHSHFLSLFFLTKLNGWACQTVLVEMLLIPWSVIDLHVNRLRGKLEVRSVWKRCHAFMDLILPQRTLLSCDSLYLILCVDTHTHIHTRTHTHTNTHTHTHTHTRAHTYTRMFGRTHTHTCHGERSRLARLVCLLISLLEITAVCKFHTVREG